MNKDVRKGFLIGLGITSLAAERIEKETKRFLKDHDISRVEAQKLAREFSKDVKKHQTKAIAFLEKELKQSEKKLKKKASKLKASL